MSGGNDLFRKSASYLVMSTIVAVPYVALVSLATTLLRPGLILPVLIPLLIVLILALHPIWNRVQNRVHKCFYQQRYNFLKNLESFNQEVHSISDIGNFGSSIVELLNQALEDTHISLLLLTESQDYNAIATTEGSSANVNIKRNNPVIKWLKLNMKLLRDHEINLIPQLQALTDKQKKQIENIELFAPLITPSNEMVGILLLGPQKSGRKYDQSDEQLITTITKRVSIELENARLYNLEKGMRKELETQDEQKTEFLYSIAHELKTPLAAIISSSELLSGEISARSNHREENLIRNVSRSAWWMNKRVTELLDLAKLEISTIELNLAPVNIGSVIKDIASRLFYVFKNKGQTLKTQLPKGLPKVNGDLERLEQIMFNLLSNANKYSPTDSVIMLHVVQNNSRVVVEVEDAGPSVSDQDKKRIFEPYYRGSDYDMIKRLPGLSLGLAICKKLVIQHQGEIWVTPKHQRGNIFSFSIPIHKPETPANKKK
ncbi:MAG: GAF domain-containing protein [Chloroflexi bacterium]|mgnify:CR=1 FL=1|nr:GAF domain-containing protein [Chloroflexota bacterium]MBT7081545.1 GAF domain-containing protein [Chloroflexota bacterium]MBT7289431.1 GAF domain-containing protein [Chloroflexota bacterium]